MQYSRMISIQIVVFVIFSCTNNNVLESPNNRFKGDHHPSQMLMNLHENLAVYIDILGKE